MDHDLLHVVGALPERLQEVVLRHVHEMPVVHRRGAVPAARQDYFDGERAEPDPLVERVRVQGRGRRRGRPRRSIDGRLRVGRARRPRLREGRARRRPRGRRPEMYARIAYVRKRIFIH